MKKLIHFSDLHIGFEDCGQRFHEIIQHMIFTKQPASSYAVIITGDLVDRATNPANYLEALLYVDKIRAAGYEVLIVPGNHDYGNGFFGSKSFVSPFKRTFLGRDKVEYPKLDIIEKVAFIGLDSMAEELHWHDFLFANGELGSPQLDRLVALLKGDQVRLCERRVVYLHHHPFHPRGPMHMLKDSEELGEVLKAHGPIDALLFGHNHEGGTFNGYWGIERCYDAGSTTHKEGSIGYHRIIDLDRDARMDYDAKFGGHF